MDEKIMKKLSEVCERLSDLKLKNFKNNSRGGLLINKKIGDKIGQRIRKTNSAIGITSFQNFGPHVPLNQLSVNSKLNNLNKNEDTFFKMSHNELNFGEREISVASNRKQDCREKMEVDEMYNINLSCLSISNNVSGEKKKFKNLLLNNIPSSDVNNFVVRNDIGALLSNSSSGDDMYTGHESIFFDKSKLQSMEINNLKKNNQNANIKSYNIIKKKHCSITGDSFILSQLTENVDVLACSYGFSTTEGGLGGCSYILITAKSMHTGFCRTATKAMSDFVTMKAFSDFIIQVSSLYPNSSVKYNICSKSILEFLMRRKEVGLNVLDAFSKPTLKEMAINFMRAESNLKSLNFSCAESKYMLGICEKLAYQGALSKSINRYEEETCQFSKYHEYFTKI
uniref:Sec16_C domain-containing protein n=1 Tax=Strongyloides papillosus TaxID=174720 RepID=A0A0N5C9P1_STREA